MERCAEPSYGVSWTIHGRARSGLVKHSEAAPVDEARSARASFKSKWAVNEFRTEIHKEIPIMQDRTGTAAWFELPKLVEESVRVERRDGYLLMPFAPIAEPPISAAQCPCLLEVLACPFQGPQDLAVLFVGAFTACFGEVMATLYCHHSMVHIPSMVRRLPMNLSDLSQQGFEALLQKPP